MTTTLKVRDLKPGEVMVDLPFEVPPDVIEMLTRLLLHSMDKGTRPQGHDVVLVAVNLQASASLVVAKPDMQWHESAEPKAVVPAAGEGVSRGE